MSTGLLWSGAVIGYTIQTQALSKALTQQPYSINISVSILYFLAWLLILPITRYWNNTHINIDMLPIDQVEDNAFTYNSPSSKLKSNIIYLLKILTLSVCIAIPVLSYVVALSITPAFDVALIQNLASFEIVTLLYGVCNIAKKQNVFRNFVVMMIAVISVLIVSYTNATGDLLAGKLTINPETGEVNDPFLFDRLKASLLCGLGSLLIGPFAVLLNNWFGPLSNTPSNAKKNLFAIAFCSIILLLPLTANDANFWNLVVKNENNMVFYFLLAFIGGTVPNLVCTIKLNSTTPPEFLTTLNLSAIVAMGIIQWVCESGKTIVVRWEVISYTLLSLCAVFLYYTLGYTNEKSI